MAPLNHAEFSCGGAADIDHPASDKWSSVVDPHHHGLAVDRIGHAHSGAKGEGFVGGGHGVHVEQLAIGSHPAVKPLAVIGRRAAPQAADDIMPLARRGNGGEVDRVLFRARAIERRLGVERGKVFVKLHLV